MRVAACLVAMCLTACGSRDDGARTEAESQPGRAPCSADGDACTEAEVRDGSEARVSRFKDRAD